MENRVTDDHICKLVREGYLFDAADLKILRRQPGAKRYRELANVVNSRGIRVHREDLAAVAKQVNEIPAISAPGVEYAHALVDISAEDLIEYINIDLAELFLNIQRCASTFDYSTVTDFARLRGWSTSQPRRTAM
jgi:hypothetical protein